MKNKQHPVIATFFTTSKISYM